MAQIDPRIPLMAIPRRNMLESFHEGQMMRQQAQMGQMKQKAMKNALMEDAVRKIAQGVLSSPDPASAYPIALRRAQAMGMDTSGIPEQWGPEAEMMARMVAAGPEKRAVWEQKANALVQMGVDPKRALAITTGAMGAHPVTGEPYDLTGLGIGGGQGYGVSPPSGAPAGGQPPSGGSDFLPGLDQPSQQERAQTGFGVAGEAPEGVDYPSAFGAEGVLKNVANVASDFVGAGQVYPDTATAKRQIENLNTQTATLLAEGTETRGGKYLIDRFDKIQAEAAGIQGPEDALKTLQEIRGLLQRAYEINQNIAQSQVRPTEKSSAIATLRRLEPMIDEYGKIIDTFQSQYYGPQEGPADMNKPQPEAPPGLPPEVQEVWEFMTPEERALWQN